MRRWVTIIHAIDPTDDQLKSWCGPTIQAPTWDLAQDKCNRNGLGYCMVIGELIAECDAEDTSKIIYYGNEN